MLKKLTGTLVLVSAIATGMAQSYIINLAPVGGAATGSGGGTLTLSGTTLTFNNVTYSGLSGNSTISHIHGPLPATGVALSIPAGVTTYGSTSGSFNGSIPNLTAAQINNLNANLYYLNVHSSTFPGGEISGVITLVPEPSTAALMGLMGAGALALRRRR